jgi:hypothetical protein
MSWQPNEDQIALFSKEKQRSAAFTLKRRALRSAMLEFASELPGDWGCTPAEPCLANRRQVQNLVLFSVATRPDGQRASIDLNSPFALDVLPYHEHLSRFVQFDQDGLTWGLILHRKAKLDTRNLSAFLQAFEGEVALANLLVPLDGALTENDVEAPKQEGQKAGQLLPDGKGKGWCLWWRAEDFSDDLCERLAGDLARCDALFDAIKWTPQNDLCGALAEHKAVREEASKSRFREGDRVRIIAGLFAGRIGRVEKRNDSGGVSLGIGPVTIQVADHEISPL